MEPKMNSAAEYYIAGIKRQTVRGFGKYLIDHASKFPDGTMGLSAMDIADLTVQFLEECK